jgi:hypothetical protein
MEQAKPRLSVLKDQIKHQIELVAELICAGECAVGAVHMLNHLTRELIAEEQRLGDTGLGETKPLASLACASGYSGWQANPTLISRRRF